MWDSFAMRMAELCLAVRENAYFRATGNKMVETMVAEHKLLMAQKSGKVKENPSLHDKINAKERRKMRARVRVKQENLVVLQNAGIPNVLAHNIVNMKENLDRAEETKNAIQKLQELAANGEKHWDYHGFKLVQSYIGILVSNTDFLDEPWFKKHWNFLFEHLLRESWSNLLWYVHSERERKGWLEDDVMRKIMFIKTKIINTLVKMDPPSRNAPSYVSY